MRAYVFTGPTIRAEEAKRELEADYLPPAAQGDIYRAALDRPDAIGLVDGYFERVPAVWHKEVLWALSQGIAVFGSASMGALRAAELCAFGMIGVGSIFEALRDGVLEDDDEVAVAHAGPSDGYRTLSEPMVNVRATLSAARDAGIVAETTRESLERAAKSLFYVDRRWPSILAAAAAAAPEREVGALREWLARGRVDQKRADAVAMLRTMRTHLERGSPAPRVSYRFEHTESWERLRVRAGATPSPNERPVDAARIDQIEEEIRLEGRYSAVRSVAIARTLALEEAIRRRLRMDAAAVDAAGRAFRRSRALDEDGALARWLDEHGVRVEEFARRMREQAEIEWVAGALAPQLGQQIAAELQLAGDYGRIAGRARAKARALIENPEPTLADVGLTEPELYEWFFTDRLERPPPADMAAFAREAGFAHEDALRRAVLRERVFVTLSESGDTGRD